MNNIIDYIEWRGDLTFQQSAFNEVDNLIFAQISYLNLGVIKGQVKIEELGKIYRKKIVSRENKSENDVSDFTERVEVMFLKASESRRFKDVLVTSFVNKFDEVRESQFSAMTFIINDDLMYVAYRGTDDTLVGFKENLNMSFSAPVPGQMDAVRYLKSILERFGQSEVIVGGHSKGGNFAVFAVTQLTDRERERISTIYNNDGPGFTENILNSEGYKKTVGKVKKYIPEDSFVGILMDDEEECTVVSASASSGILQHDGLNWDVKGTEFIRKESVSKKSAFVDKTIKHWLEGLNREEREEFVNELYAILKKSMNANCLNDIFRNRFKSTYYFIKKMGSLEEDKREMLQNTVLKLIQSGSEIKREEKENERNRRINSRKKKKIDNLSDKELRKFILKKISTNKEK